MKTSLIALCSVFLAACTATLPSPAQMSVCPAKHKTEPKSSIIPGYRSIEYPVRVTNTSSRPIWFYGLFPNLPFYSIYLRSEKSSKWGDHSQSVCGVGAQFFEIRPGSFCRFTTSVSAEDAGQQLRIELPVYFTPDLTKSIPITSAVIQIK